MTDPSPPNRRRGQLGFVAVTLAVLVGAVLLRAPDYLDGHEPGGNDSSSHILAAATLADEIQGGAAGWWNPNLNLGFPLVHFYQPLPHLGTAVLALLLGGPEHATQAYKLLVLILLTALPLTTYVGMRRLGLGCVGAACAAVALTTLSAPVKYYGLTPRHYLFVGLYTLLWGAVLAPLALSEGVRLIQGRGRWLLGVGSFTLLFLSHSLIALGLIPVYIFTAFFAPAELRSTWKRRFFRVSALGLATGACIAFWLLPQLMCSDFFAGWPFGDTERIDGYGLGAVLSAWTSGKLTDFHRPPVLAAFSLLGVIACLVGVRRDSNARIALFALLLFIAFTAGRKSFGSVVDWVFPPNARIEGLSRYVALLHLTFALLVGLGADGLARLGARLPRLGARAEWVGYALPALILLVAAPRYFADLHGGLDTIPAAQDRPALLRATEALAREPDPGRVYTNVPLGHSTHWAMAYTSILANKPMTVSYGVGLQDSLGFYYLTHLSPLDPVLGPIQARLFNLRYYLIRPEIRLRLIGAEEVAREGPYRVVRLAGEYGYFELTGEPVVVEGSAPVAMREAFLHWMREGYPRGAPFLRLPEPIALRFPSLPSATSDYLVDQRPARWRSSAERLSRGTVASEEIELWRYRAELDVTETGTWTVLKVTPHPFWTAEVDGESRPIYHLSPAFMGIPVERGRHTVVFSFRAPLWQKILLACAPLVLLSLAFLDRKAQLREPA